jgi:hypothetical protein
MSVQSRNGIVWFLLLLVWRGPLPVVHCHELTSGERSEAIRLELHQAVLHGGHESTVSPGGWHWHWVLPDQMLVAMGAEHLACPVVQLENAGIEGPVLDRQDRGDLVELFDLWAGAMAACDLFPSPNAAPRSSMARMSCRSVWPNGHLLRC